MIDLNKKYKCKKGFVVKLFHKNEIDGSIIGAYFSALYQKWLPLQWFSNGECTENNNDFDLVMVEPEIISKPKLIKYLGAYYSIPKCYDWANYIALDLDRGVWIYGKKPELYPNCFYPKKNQ